MIGSVPQSDPDAQNVGIEARLDGSHVRIFR
jgi:hypothetical protein